MKIRYFHPAFIDSAHSLMNEYKDDTSNTLLVLGYYYYGGKYEDLVMGYDHVIMFNQENYFYLSTKPYFNSVLDGYLKADEVWDYSEDNIPLFARHGIKSSLHILKPYMKWDVFAPVEKNIDILIYGSQNNRRHNLVEFLRKKYNVVYLDGVFGSVLDDYILRSRILLNCHGSSEFVMEQEQARMVKWLGAPCQIISERSPKNYLNVPEMDYWELFCL